MIIEGSLITDEFLRLNSRVNCTRHCNCKSFGFLNGKFKHQQRQIDLLNYDIILMLTFSIFRIVKDTSCVELWNGAYIDFVDLLNAWPNFNILETQEDQFLRIRR